MKVKELKEWLEGLCDDEEIEFLLYEEKPDGEGYFREFWSEMCFEDVNFDEEGTGYSMTFSLKNID